MYNEKYELDKRFSFRWPRLKKDLEAYLNQLLQIVDRSIETSEYPRVKGHVGLVYKSDKVEDEENEE
ncbi:MAG: hypothetical protein K9L56_14585 [Clostridiales bacterium]|nr:hypothetical protein [Clostridiales bacterium]